MKRTGFKKKLNKHRHKWILDYVDASTCGRGLLYSCECGLLLEFKRKENYKKATKVLLEFIRDNMY